VRNENKIGVAVSQTAEPEPDFRHLGVLCESVSTEKQVIDGFCDS
jgi:hypothetical protein